MDDGMESTIDQWLREAQQANLTRMTEEDDARFAMDRSPRPPWDESALEWLRTEVASNNFEDDDPRVILVNSLIEPTSGFTQEAEVELKTPQQITLLVF